MKHTSIACFIRAIAIIQTTTCAKFKVGAGRGSPAVGAGRGCLAAGAGRGCLAVGVGLGCLTVGGGPGFIRKSDSESEI